MTYRHDTDCMLQDSHTSPCFGGTYDTLRFGAVRIHLPADQGEGTRAAWMHVPATPNHADPFALEVADLNEAEAVRFAGTCGMEPSYPCQLDYADGSALVPLRRDDAAANRAAWDAIVPTPLD